METKEIKETNVKKAVEEKINPVEEAANLTANLFKNIGELNAKVAKLESENQDLKEQLAVVGKQIGLSEDLITLLGRNEALNVFVSILNAFLAVRQEKENKIPDDEIVVLQGAINQISALNQKQYDDIQKALGIEVPEEKKEEKKEEKPKTKKAPAKKPAAKKPAVKKPTEAKETK